MRAHSLILFSQLCRTGVEIGTVTTLDDFSRLYGEPGEVCAAASDLQVVETTLGYTFRHGALLREAFTHPSKLDEVSFERIEWVGDAVLDFHVVRYCWHRWSGDLGPGHLTELKGACVSNETLAALAVELNLDRFLVYDPPQLETNMRLYRERVVAAKEKELREAAQEAREPRPYWLTLDPPKVRPSGISSRFLGFTQAHSSFSTSTGCRRYRGIAVRSRVYRFRLRSGRSAAGFRPDPRAIPRQVDQPDKAQN